MPKIKTKSAAKKRFTLTGTGKIKRHHAYHSHILTKNQKRENVTWLTALLSNKTWIAPSNKCWDSASLIN